MKRKGLRWWAWIGLGTGALGGGALVGALGFALYLRTPAGNDWLASRLMTVLSGAMVGGEARLGKLRTDLWSYAYLEDLALIDEAGTTVIGVGQANLSLDLWPLLSGTVAIPEGDIRDLVVIIDQDAAGDVNVAKMFGAVRDVNAAVSPWEGLPVNIEARRLRVGTGQFRFLKEGREMVALHGLDGGLDFVARGPRLAAENLKVDAFLENPGLIPLAADGTVVYTGDHLDLEGIHLRLPDGEATLHRGFDLANGAVFDLGVEAQGLALADLDSLLGAQGFRSRLGGTVDLQGPSEALVVTLDLTKTEGAPGKVAGVVNLDLAAEELKWDADLALTTLTVSEVFPLAEPVVLQGQLALDGEGIDWPEKLWLTGDFTSDGPQTTWGYELSALAGQFRLEKGKLFLPKVNTEGLVGDLAASGALDLESGELGLEVSGPIDLRELSKFGLEGMRGQGPTKLTLRGDVIHGGALNVVGRSVVSGFAFQGDTRFGRVEADYNLEIQGSVVDGTAGVTATGGDAKGALIGKAVAPKVVIHRDDGGMTIQTGVSFEEVRYEPVHVVRGDAIVDVTFVDAEDYKVHADVTPGEFDALGFFGTGGVAAVDVTPTTASFGVELVDGERSFLSTKGSFGLVDGMLALDHLAASPVPRQTWSSEGPVRFQTVDGGFPELSMAFVGPLGRIVATGQLPKKGPVNAKIIVERLHLDAVTELFPESVPVLGGIVDLEATISGDASNPEVVGTINGKGVYVEDQLRYTDITGTFEDDEGLLGIDLTLAVGKKPFVDVAGTVPVRLSAKEAGIDWRGKVDVGVVVRPGPLSRFSDWSPKVPALPADAQMSGTLTAKGSLEDPALTASTVMRSPVAGWSQDGRVELYVERTGGKVSGWADLRQGYDERVTVGLDGATRLSEVFAWVARGGEAPAFDDYTLYLDDWTVAAGLLGVPVEALTGAAGLEVDAHGELVGGLTVTGSPMKPVVDGAVSLLDGRLGEVALPGGFLSWIPEGQGYRLDSQVQLDAGVPGDVAVSGLVPVVVDLEKGWEQWFVGDLDLGLTGSGVPLSLIEAFDPNVREPTGMMVVGGHVGGRYEKPIYDVSLAIDNGSFVYSPIGIRFRDLKIDAKADEKQLVLKSFSTRTEPSRDLLKGLGDIGSQSKIVASGSTRIEGGALGALSAQVELTDAWVSATSSLKLRAGGGVKVGGRWPELQVRGSPRLVVVSGDVFRDSASFLSVGALELDPALVVHRGEVPIAIVPEEEGVSWMERLDVEVPVRLNRNLRTEVVLPFLNSFGDLGAAVTSMRIEARLGTSDDEDLVYSLKDGIHRLIGEVQVLDGRVAVLQSRFDLKQGKVSFIGQEISDPTLDLQAEMVLSDATVGMRISGTPSQPIVDLKSQEYPDQSQILTMLLTGRSPGELGANQGQQAAQALAGLLVNSVLSGVRLGSFSVDSDGSVRVGFPISGTLFAETMFAAQPDLQRNRLQGTLEWRVLPRLVLAAGVGDVRSWADALYEIRF